MSSEFWDFLKFLKILTLWPSRFQLWWLRKIEIFERYQNLRLVTDSDWLIIDEYCQDFVSLRAFHVIDFNIKGKLYFITNYLIYNRLYFIKTLLILGYHMATLWFLTRGDTQPVSGCISWAHSMSPKRSYERSPQNILEIIWIGLSTQKIFSLNSFKKLNLGCLRSDMPIYQLSSPKAKNTLCNMQGMKMSVFRFVIRTYNRVGFLLGVFTFSVDSDYEKRKLSVSSKSIFNMQFKYTTKVMHNMHPSSSNSSNPSSSNPSSSSPNGLISDVRDPRTRL